MKNKLEIDDSLSFCKDIEYYESDKKNLQFNEENYPRLKEYIGWEKTTEVHKQQETTKHDSFNPKESLEAYSLKQFCLQLIACILISFLIVTTITKYVVTFTRVSGISMENTLQNGDFLMVDRLSYRFKDPEQFDVIVFQQDTDVYYVKRIIALPGQTVQIVNGQIIVDGVVLTEEYGAEEIIDPGSASDEITLKDDEYFVLGDNRNKSTDSRFVTVGMIKKERIIGKVFMRVYPMNTIGRIE